jgi:glyoxylase-like metal-dependent hydrolase (beta-lactamase superfamily II)
VTVQAGGWDVTMIRLGVIHVPADHIAPAGVIDDPVAIPVNALVLRGHGLAVLVDAGNGPVNDWLPNAPAPDPAETGPITHLVLTHLDLDHAGGALAGTWPAPLTPRYDAPVLLLADGLGWWRTQTPGPDQLNVGTDVVRIVEDAGRLVAVASGAEPLPGVRLVAAPGHSPGHAVIEIGDTFLYAADIIHHPLHLAHPVWDRGYDHDPLAGLATRRRWLGRIADRGVIVAFSHLDGFGRVERAGDGFAWRPLDTA